MYLLDSPRRGDSYKYPNRMFSQRIKWDSMKKYTIADFCADQIDVITNFAVITNAIINSVHCKFFFSKNISIHNFTHIHYLIFTESLTNDFVRLTMF